MADQQTTAVSADIACIDLSNPDIQQSVALLKQACMDSGIFYVINHGIEELIDEVFAESKRFFELPLEDKMKLLWTNYLRGYQPMGVVDIETKIPDHREAFHMGYEVPEDDPDGTKRFYCPNVWPPADILPGWKEIMQRYQRETLAVGRAIARIIALALGLSIDFFDQPEMLGKPIANFDILHYGVNITDHSRGTLGSPPHTDFGIITLLATDEISGLQICRDKFAKPQLWENVSPLKGAFIVNIGQMLERFSNGVFRPTLHRVLFQEDRYSMALFLGPSHDCIVECLPNHKSEENPPKFPQVKSEEHLSGPFKLLTEYEKNTKI